MTQFSALTQGTKAIVVDFCNAQMKKNMSCEPNKQLMVSLYSLMPKADSKVVRILNQYVVSLPTYFSESQINMLRSEYPAVVKFCYDHKNYAGAQTRKSKEFNVPQSLMELCMGTAKPKAGSSVLVPYSGDGSFAYYVSDCMIDGFESDETSWAFSQILLHSQNAISSIKLQESLDSSSKQYEYIFSFPPMRPGRDGRAVVDVVYNLITKKLQENGELYCILPMSFCSVGSGWFDIRKTLWDKSAQYSVLVVSLPHILRSMSGINLCLLHVKKNYKDIVTLIDATGDEFSAKIDVAGHKERVLKVPSIIETINGLDEKYVWVGNFSQLTGNVNLQPSRYLIPRIIPLPKEGEKSIKLSEVIRAIPLTMRDEKTLQIIRKKHRLSHPFSENVTIDPEESVKVFEEYRKLEQQGYPFIGIKELSSSYLNCDIQRDTLEASTRVECRVLTSDCLLVGFMGGKFKVGRLHGVSATSPVTLGNEVIPVEISSDTVTEDFLLRSIMSEQSELQARMLATGTAITRLSKEDFLSIVINVPRSKEQQGALCKEDTLSSMTVAERKVIESFEEFRRDIHMKKHAIGQTILNFNNWWDELQMVRKEGNGIVDDNAIVGIEDPIRVAEIYENLKNTIKELQQQISKLDRGNGLQVERFALTTFIENYIKTHPSPLFSFEYNPDAHYHSQDIPDFEIDDNNSAHITEELVAEQEDPIEYVTFAPDALTIIFDNIKSNACSHGFVGRETGNVIKIEILSDGDKFVVTVANNGWPINNQLSSADVFTYGKTTYKNEDHDTTKQEKEQHYGIGGYEISRLMHEFNGSAELVVTPEEEFTVCYRLTFNDTNINVSL